MKVLIAEDDPAIQTILRMVLTKVGHCEVVQVFAGDRILPMVLENRPDLILLDVMMPEMSGLDACRSLKRNPQATRAPVIFLTAMSTSSQAQEAMGLGAIGYITKPFDPMTLVPQINALLAPLGCSLGV